VWYVVAALTSLGHRAQIEFDSRSLPRLDVAALALAPPPLRQLFHSPATLAGGILPIMRGFPPHDAMPELIRLYPSARIVVAVANRRLARSWLDRLRASALTQPIMSADELMADWTNRPKCVVMSFDHLDRGRREDFDLVIVPDITPLRDVMPTREVVGRSRPRLTRAYDLMRRIDVPAFGFIPSRAEWGEGEQLRLLAMFGNFIHRPNSVLTGQTLGCDGAVGDTDRV
jgi:hypothetical protein